MTPEEEARQLIDEKLTTAGWLILDRKNFDRFAGLGVACREFLLADNTEADYMLFIDGKAAGVIEAKKAHTALSGIENQSKGYSGTLPDYVKHWAHPLPFIYESNGSETFFTDTRDPHPQARRVFSFHQPQTLKNTLDAGTSLRERLQHFPPLEKASLRDCQFDAITHLEKSLGEGRPRALIQLATGSGKTYTACNFTYRLLKHAKAKRILFLVDRNNLGRQTRQKMYETLDEDLTYSPEQLDRAVTSLNQIRTVLQTYKDNVFTALFPERASNPDWLPKTLIFAKDDNHAETIVRIAREVFAQGNDFCKKITYNVSGVKPEELINEFRNSPTFRIAVTVDMIATGTDVKPLEVLIFMRDVHSELYYEQMKGRGCRTIPLDDLRSVTPNAVCKSKFILIDAVGVTESKKSVPPPLERKKAVPFKKLLESVALGKCDDDTLSSLAARVSALEKSMDEKSQTQLQEKCNTTLKILANDLLDAIDPDHLEHKTPAEAEQIKEKAIRPFSNPALRDMLLNNARKAYMYVDDITPDTGTIKPTTDREQEILENLKTFIEKNKDELTALSIIYYRSYGKKHLTYNGIKELADALANNTPTLDIPVLWGAFMRVNPSKVTGTKRPEKMLTNVIQLIRFALGQDEELKPFDTVATARYNLWLGRMKKRGIVFTHEQTNWLNEIRNYIISNASISYADLQQDPVLSDKGGLLKARQVFAGLDLPHLITNLNTTLLGADNETGE